MTDITDQPSKQDAKIPNKTVEPLSRQKLRTMDQKGRKAIQKKLSTLEELNITYVPIESIYPNPYNPNRQTEKDFQLLKKSIEEDGFTQPIIVHKQTKQIVDGEHRWRAMHQMGFKEIPVVYVTMTPEQMRISTLRHNRARGSEDVELSIAMLRDLRELGALDHAIDSLMISDQELTAMLDDIPAPEMMAQEEYSHAWIPSEAGGSAEDRKQETMIANRRISLSDSMVIAMQDHDLAMQDLEDNGSGNEAMRDKNHKFRQQILTITSVFTNRDARLVRLVLSPNPAQKLLDICLDLNLRHPELYSDEVNATAETLRASKSAKANLA